MRALLIGFLTLFWTSSATAQLRPMVYAEVTVDAPVNEVWNDWTNQAGLEAFFAPQANIDLKPGGAYEVLFLPDAPRGQRGAEDGVILGLQDGKMIQFTWAMPPDMPEIRPHMTVVQIIFVPVSGSRTRVRLFHTGFGDSEAWAKGRDYLAKTWPEVLQAYRAHKIQTPE